MSTSPAALLTDDALNPWALFEALPGNYVLIKADAPHYTILAATPGYLRETGRNKENTIGKGTFEAFPGNNTSTNTGESDLQASYQHVLTRKEPHFLPVQRYDLQNEDGSFSERHWRIGNSPVLGPGGEVDYIINSAEDITHEIKARQQEEKIKGLEQAYGLFMQVPFAVHIFSGPELVIDLANPPTLELWGKTDDPTGKRFLDVLPELKGQGYEQMMREVMQTRTPKFFYEVPLALNRPGKDPVGYYNFVYQPYYKRDAATADSVLIIANEVTQQVLARQQASESERSLGLAVEIAQLGVFNINLKTGIAAYSQPVADWFGFERLAHPLAEILKNIHPADQPMVGETIERSIAGEWDGRHDLVYRVLHPATGAVQYLRSIGQVLFEDGQPVSLSGIIQETTQEVIARQKLEASEANYRTLFNSLDDGFCTIEVLFDENEKPYNYRFLEINKAFEQQTGLTNAVGRTMNDFARIEDFWYETYAAVATTGKAVRFENRAENLHRFYDVYAFKTGRPEERKVAVLFTDITGRKMAEQLLQESEARFRDMIAQAPLAIGLTRGEDFVFESINGPMLQLIHQENKADVLGKKMIDDVLPEMKNQPIHDMLRRVLQTGETYTGNEVHVPLTLNGMLYNGYYNISYTRIVEPDGTPSIMHMALDVTAQVLARRTVEESEGKLKAIVEQTPAPTLVLKGDDFRIEHTNGPMLAMMGRGEDVIGQPFLSIMPELKGQAVWERVQKVYREGVSFDQPEVLVPHNRTGVMQDYYYTVAYRPLKEEGRITGMIQVAIDVTEEVLSRKKLEESEERYRTLLEETTVATAFYTGPEIRIQYANATMLRYWGKGGEVIQKTFRQALPELENQPFPGLLEAVYATGEPYIGTEEKAELVIDGELRPFYFNFTYKALRDAAGRVYAIHHTAMDVTEQVVARKKVEESEVNLQQRVLERTTELERLNKELQRSNHHLEEFAHAASHDLKEPIRKVQFFTERLKEQLKQQISAEQEQTFSRIATAGQRMGALVDDLLIYSHVSQRPHETETVDLNEKAARVLEDLELDVQEKSAVITVGRLPVVKGYQRQLQQLFQNLISNALKYSRAGVPPHINITTNETEEDGRQYHVINVQDNGIGFAQEYAEKIFQMFTRLHGKTEYSGTGVGLAIVKKVVENHNGFIEVESTQGEGSLFKVYLPAE